MSRTPFIAANWKMNKTIADAEAYIQALLPQVGAIDDVEIAVCPRVAEPAPELPAGLDLFGRERVANHVTTIGRYFNTDNCLVGIKVPT